MGGKSVGTMFRSESSTGHCSGNYVLADNIQTRHASTKADSIPCRSSGPMKSVLDGSESKQPILNLNTQMKKKNGLRRTGVENSDFYVRICLKYMMRKTVLRDDALSEQ